MSDIRKVVILGAAGRDFHNFNTVYRNREDCRVVAFTATQILGIENRVYPVALAGPNYPDGIPIRDEEDLEELIRSKGIDEAVFAYSDVSNDDLMAVGSRCLAAGASFVQLAADETMLTSSCPVIAVCAVRTGCGKSQTTRFILEILKKRNQKAVVIRHPMPYGDLAKQRLQRYETLADLERHECTIEEIEEYRPHIEAGTIVYAGVDYEAIIREAETEADIIVWDGGNNDTPFYRPDLWITVADPFRPEACRTHHPGQTNFRAADLILINKVNTGPPEGVARIERLAEALNPEATVVRADSRIEVPRDLKGKRVLVVEDGPTLTHGNMAFGAGKVAADQAGAEIVDPRPSAVGLIRKAYEEHPQLEEIVPALGYSEEQLRDLEATLDGAEADVILNASPAELTDLLELETPIVRVGYELADIHTPSFARQLEAFLNRLDEG